MGRDKQRVLVLVLRSQAQRLALALPQFHLAATQVPRKEQALPWQASLEAEFLTAAADSPKHSAQPLLVSQVRPPEPRGVRVWPEPSGLE